MNFKSLSIAASAAILSVSLMTGCGGDNDNTTEPVKETYSVNGNASAIGSLSGVTAEGLKLDGTAIVDCRADITAGSYALSCSEMPAFIKVSTTTGAEAQDLGFDSLVGGGDDEAFTDTFLATVDGNVTNVTPLAYLKYVANDGLADITDVTDAGDIFIVVTIADTLKAAGLNAEEAYKVIALSINENTTLRALKKGFKVNKSALETQMKKASDRQVADGGEPLTISDDILSALEESTNDLIALVEKIDLTDTNNKKALKTVSKKVSALVREAKKAGIALDTGAIKKMATTEAITTIAAAIVEAGGSIDLEKLSESISDDGTVDADTIKDAAKDAVVVPADGTACDDNDATTENDVYTNGVCAGTTIVVEPTTPVDGTACDDNNAYTENDVYTNGVCAGTAIVSDVTYADGTACNDGNANTVNDVYTNNVCSGTAVDVVVSANSSTFTKSLTTNTDENATYKIVDQMLKIAITDLTLTDTNDSSVYLSVSIKNSNDDANVSFSTSGGDVNNSKIIFPAGTQVILAQTNVPELGSIVGYESSATMGELVNDDLVFNIETVLNSLTANEDKITDGVKALDNFLANPDTYTMTIASSLLDSDITGTIEVDGGYVAPVATTQDELNAHVGVEDYTPVLKTGDKCITANLEEGTVTQVVFDPFGNITTNGTCNK